MGWIWHLCLMNMKRRKIRTFLTVLGVMIGVISVVALMSVGLGVKKEMIDSVVDSGSVNQIKVYSETGGKHKDRMITDKTIETFSKFSNVSGCYSVYEVPVTMKYGEYEYYGNLVGVPGDELSTWKLINGENVIKDSDGKGFAAGSSVGKLFFNPNTYTSFEKKEKKGIGSLTGRRFDTVFGWGDENAKTVKLKLTGVLADGSADIASDDDSDNTEGEVYTSTYSEKSQTIYCDMDYLKSLLKRVSVDGKLEGQPVDGNGNSYREFIYTAAIVTVDDTNNVDAIVKKFQDMGYQTENAKEYLDTIQKLSLIHI